MRKSYFIILSSIALIFPGFLNAQEIRFLDWGVEKYCSPGDGVVRVLVEIHNTSEKDETYEIMFKASGDYSPAFARSKIAVAGMTTKREELAVPSIYVRNKNEVEIRKSDGVIINKIKTPELTHPSDQNQPWAIYTPDDAAYHDLQNRFLSSGTVEDQADKSRNIRFIRPRYLPIHRWAYNGVKVILIAKPIDSFAPAELEAIEDYTRSGGHLILIESELHNEAFLSNYRPKLPDGLEQELGQGCLTRLSSAKDIGVRLAKYSDLLRNDFHGSNLQSFDYLQHTLGTIYSFPKFYWLIAILGIFLLLVGPINFAILRRIQRREWGWFTVAAISIACALALFLFAFARRPSHLSIDEFSFAEMDGRSNKAVISTRVRVSSPTRVSIQIHLPGDAELAQDQQSYEWRLLRTSHMGNILEIWPNLQWTCELQNLSFADRYFRVQKRLSGNVVRTGATGLHNESGMSFDAAILVTPQQFYQLGSFQNGATKDIESSEHSPLSSHYLLDDDETHYGSYWLKSFASQPFSIARLAETQSKYAWNAYFAKHSALFIGISQADPSVRIDISKAVQQHKMVTIIKYQ
jgi:hypothetical protein